MKNFRNILRRHFIKEFKDVVGSQFSLIDSFIPKWALLSRFKQNLIHLFWDVWIFFDSLLFKEGY